MAYPVPNKPMMRPPLTSGTSLKPATGGSGAWIKGLVTLIVAIIIIGGGVYLLARYTGLSQGAASGLTAEWQAVFLTNGQVYFGKVSKVTGDNVYLRDIYYLQVVNQPLQASQQAGETAEQPAAEPAEPEQRLTLIKLGNELHGPRDEMIINREHVILMEDLKDDSRVVQAISDYIANQ